MPALPPALPDQQTPDTAAYCKICVCTCKFVPSVLCTTKQLGSCKAAGVRAAASYRHVFCVNTYVHILHRDARMHALTPHTDVYVCATSIEAFMTLCPPGGRRLLADHP